MQYARMQIENDRKKKLMGMNNNSSSHMHSATELMPRYEPMVKGSLPNNNGGMREHSRSTDSSNENAGKLYRHHNGAGKTPIEILT